MVLPQPDSSPHTHRPSIVLPMAAQRDSCLPGEGINCSKSEKTKPCKQIQEFWTQNIQRVEVKREWTQGKGKWMDRKINHKIDINLSSFYIQTANQNEFTNRVPNR